MEVIMKKRIFPIDSNCFIIYTGLSSADNHSFIRIGTSSHVTKAIQSRTRYIVVPDVSRVDIDAEVRCIEHAGDGAIRYICNKKNQGKLFSALRAAGVGDQKLGYRGLSRELENMNRLENKKHFFTVFYQNKNIKIISNDEIVFDLFECEETKFNYAAERKRLSSFIQTLDSLYTRNISASFSFSKLKQPVTDNYLDFADTAFFVIQNSYYFHCSLGMLSVSSIKTGKSFDFTFNCSQRYSIGKKLGLTVLERGKNKISLDGLILEGEVIESGVLYSYTARFAMGDDAPAFYGFLQLYDYLLGDASA
jgi:hypothetical protein